MNKYLPVFISAVFLFLIYFVLKSQNLLTPEQMNNCVIVTSVLAVLCIFILEYLKRQKGSGKKNLVKFVLASLLMTVVFIGLIIVYLLENEQSSNYYLFSILINYIVFKMLLVRGILKIQE